MIEVPYQQLSPQTLEALIESFVLREGTDYGEHEYTLADKLVQVKRQIVAGEILITFDPTTESCNLLPAEITKSHK